MKIHQIAPPYIPVDPDIAYGGIERVAYQLDRRLAKMGHATSMSVPGGSRPVGRLYETVQAVGFGGERRLSELDEFLLKMKHAAAAILTANAHDFDVVHVHDENLLPFASLINKKSVYTIHSIPEEFWKPDVHTGITDAKNLVAVSNRIRQIYNGMGFDVKYVVHNGFDIGEEHFSSEKLDYMFVLGIIRPMKGQDVAIDVSEAAGKSLIIGGNIGDVNYFDALRSKITHSIEHEKDKRAAYERLPKGRKVVYAGELNDAQKFPLFSGAEAFLVPSLMEDSLPGVVIEAMACGTPVVGFNRGGIPEMIDDGRTGYVVETNHGMVVAANSAAGIYPADCRSHYEANFTSEVMARNYIKIYEEVR